MLRDQQDADSLMRIERLEVDIGFSKEQLRRILSPRSAGTQHQQQFNTHVRSGQVADQFIGDRLQPTGHSHYGDAQHTLGPEDSAMQGGPPKKMPPHVHRQQQQQQRRQQQGQDLSETSSVQRSDLPMKTKTQAANEDAQQALNLSLTGSERGLVMNALTGSEHPDMPLDPKLQELIGMFDADGDGSISREEFTGALASQQGSTSATALGQETSVGAPAFVDISDELERLRQERADLLGKSDQVRDAQFLLAVYQEPYYCQRLDSAPLRCLYELAWPCAHVIAWLLFVDRGCDGAAQGSKARLLQVRHEIKSAQARLRSLDEGQGGRPLQEGVPP
eukprot:COSAG02_NODE_4985_length_4749_cov_5.434409_2_plen_335_part_00